MTRSDNHVARKLSKGKAKLPDIVKRGPINDKNPKKVVGLSIKKNDEPKFVKKRNSLENTKRTGRTNARNAILKAQVPS